MKRAIELGSYAKRMRCTPPWPDRRVFQSACGILFGLLGTTSSAYATGDSYSRLAENARIGARSVVNGCPGRLLENFDEHGNVFSFSFSLSLVCTTSKSAAAWVLLSSAQCWDESEDSVCSQGEQLPQVDLTETGNRAPFVSRYRLFRYGLGRDCTIVTQPVSMYPKSAIRSSSAWLCGQLDFSDGTVDDKHNVLRPKVFKTVPVETIGATARAPVLDDRPLNGGFEIDLPMRFVTPSNYYTYEVKRGIK